MRIELISFKTWLSAVLALWALIVLGLALFGGLGGQIKSVQGPAETVERLPQPAPIDGDRLGNLDDYAELSNRPLLSTDRKLRPFFINEGETGAEGVTTGFDFVLTSVLITPDFNMAILQSTQSEPTAPVRVRLGDAPASAPGWRLTDLQPRRAVFEGPEGQRVLNLRIFDGKGGIIPQMESNVAGGGTELIGEPLLPGDQTSVVPGSPAYPEPPPEEAEDATLQQRAQIRNRIQERRRQLRESQR